MNTRILGGTATLMLLQTGTVAQPVITSEPVNKVATVWGDRITLSVSATGTEPISYQWYFRDQPLAGRTNALLVLTNVTFANSGPYHVTVEDVSGLIPSNVATVSVPAPAVLDQRIGTNIRQGIDPDLLPANRRAQAEPHVTRSFSNPGLLVAAFQEGRREDGAADACGYSVSHDGGLTWTRSLLPGLTRINGGPYFRAGDSVVAMDLDGTVYISHIVFKTSAPPPTAAVISKSTDGGRSFGPPKVIFSFTPETDKVWLTANSFAGSPNQHRLVAIGNVFGDGNDQLHCSISDDRGDTWSPARPLGPRQGVYAQSLFLPDGSLGIIYVHYLDNLGEVSASARMEFIRSPDGGISFEPPVEITDLTGKMFHDPIARDAWDVPMACTDRQAGVIYVTFQALKDTGGTRRVPGIFFTRSIDQGRTWTAPIAVNDTPSGAGVFNPCIAATPDGQHVTIAFYDKRHNTPTSGGNLTDYYLAESFDGGATWEPNLRLSDVSSDLRMAPLTGIGRMFADYQGIVPALNPESPGVAVWIDTRTGNPDPFAVRIHRTRGSTFKAWSALRFPPTELETLGMSENDPDQDGFSNRAEYVLGGNPRIPDHALLHIEYQPGTTTLSIQHSRFDVAPYDSAVEWFESADLRQWNSIPADGDNILEVPSANPAASRWTLVPSVGQFHQYFRPVVRSQP